MPDPARHLARTHAVRLLLVVALAACGNGTSSRTADRPPTAAPALTARLGDDVVVVGLTGDLITAVTPAPAGTAATGWLFPSVIDSHVHLAFWPVAPQLADHGVAAVVDLSAPIETLGERPPAPLTVLASGPMITSPSGYPLDAWGPDGFGIGCADAACVERTVGELADKGARVIKLPIAEDGLAPELVKVAVAAAHARKLRVAAHALGDREAALAAAAGCDLLAHTPIDRLSDATVAAWKGRAVISTLAAFGGGVEAVDNLRRLRAAGVTVLYGTDLGNQRDDGPSADELALLAKAGLDPAAIADAMTKVPAAYWGLDRLGAVGAGREASFVVLDADPRVDATAILKRRAVYLKGVKR